MRRKISRSLKTNKADPIKLNTLRHLMASFVREESFDGKDYYVIPSIAIVEGVHNNVYYPGEELSKFPEAWNGVPITNGHPVDKNNSPLSASNPKVLSEYQIGLLFNTTYETPKLKTEIWLDKTKCSNINPDIIVNLLDNIPTDVSTGLFTEDDVEEGEFNGIKYNRIAHNYRPDHLAILPNDVGACSWDDGAGMARLNNKKIKDEKAVKNLVEEKEIVYNLTVNEASHSQIRDGLSNAVKESIVLSDSEYVWPIEIWDKYFVYELDKKDQKYKYFKQSYVMDVNDVIALVGEPIEVIKEITYRPKITTNKKEIVMERDERVKALIADENSNWAEADSKFLTGLDDDQFDKVEKTVATPKVNTEADKAPEVASIEPAKAPEVDADKELEKDLVPKVNTVEEFIESAPEGMQDVLRSSVEMHNNKKIALVEKLRANKSCKFAEDELSAKGLKELECLSELAGEVVDYSGAGSQPEVKTNADDNTAPEMPEMDWSK